MILTNTYFQGELSLPNLSIKSEAVGHASTAMQTIGENNLDWFIDRYEKEFLDKLLGSTLSNNFINGLSEPTVNQIWIDMKNAIYKDGKYSPAANYVYYWVKRDGRTQSSVDGEKIGTQNYSEIAKDADKLVKAWNSMCVMVINFYCEFLDPHWDVYKEYAGNDIRFNNFNKINPFGI